jgi:pullulanase/glycogen debranching enzyme
MEALKDKVVYQIYDTNGDGLGDLKGVTAKLDYLADLGVDYLWLTPFFPSPQRDNGYDVADYRAIDPRYGTMEDLEELIREADKRGIGLMLDMVFNHTSTVHGSSGHWPVRKSIRITTSLRTEPRTICPQTGCPSSVARHGSMCRSWASGICTCSM